GLARAGGGGGQRGGGQQQQGLAHGGGLRNGGEQTFECTANAAVPMVGQLPSWQPWRRPGHLHPRHHREGTRVHTPTLRLLQALSCSLLLALPAAALARDGASQTAPTTIPELAGDIAIDGVIDEGAWQQAATIDLAYEINPGDNVPAPVATVLRIGHTRDALYMAFDARDPDPSRIRAHLADRDSSFSDDFVGVMLDTFDDQRRAYEIFVNPLGVQMDLVREDATNNEDPSWDGLWTSAGRITP